MLLLDSVESIKLIILYEFCEIYFSMCFLFLPYFDVIFIGLHLFPVVIYIAPPVAAQLLTFAVVVEFLINFDA